MNKKEIIASSILFDGLPADQVEALADIAVIKNYEKGENIFFEGDLGIGFYVVGTGKVKISKISFAGKEHILHIFGGGEPFGEVPVFNGRPFPATAEALIATKALFFPREKFVRLVEANPSLALNMLAVLSFRLRKFANQIENLSLKEVPARLANYLVFLSEEQKNDEFVELEISKGQLASLLGTIPETLSRIFSKMNDEGLIEVNGKRITLLDLAGLKDKK
jgi:CRP/FNR family transcriptional regulator